MTTTIIIEATALMTLYIIFFCMKDVCLVNIHPPFQKKNSASNFISVYTNNRLVAIEISATQDVPV